MTHLELNKPQIIPFEDRHIDNRGWFKNLCFPEDIDFTVKQISTSFGYENTVKGLHLHFNMSKMVRVISGQIIDIAVNFNDNSKFLASSFVLNNKTGWCYIPKGYGHGIIYTEDSEIEYLLSEKYNIKDCHFIDIFDSQIGYNSIQVGFLESFKLKCIMSEQDKKGLKVSQWLFR